MNKKVVLSVLSTTLVASLAASAFAAPKDGIYIGGDIKKFYSTDVLFEMTPAAKTAYNNELKTMATNLNNVVFVDYKGNGASLQEMFDKGGKVALGEPLKKEDFADLYKVVNKDGSSTATENAREKVDGTTPGDLKVESVSANNLKTITVNLNAPLDSVSTSTVKLYNAAGTDLGLTPELSADGKSVYFVGSFAQDTTYKVKFIDAVYQTSKKFNAEQSVTVKDITSPEVASVKAPTSKSLEISFSEPVDLSSWNVGYALRSAVKVDGVAQVASFTFDNNTSKLTLNLGTALTAGAHTVEVGQFADFAGFKSAEKSFSVTVGSDTVAPEVTAVEVLRNNQIKVTFNEPVAKTDLGTLTVDNSNTTTWVSATADNKTHTFSLNSALTLASVVEANLTYVGTKDAEGNAVTTAKTFKFKATDDTTKATATVAVSDTNAVVITYSEPMSVSGTVVVKDQNGVTKKTLVNPAFKDTTNKVVELTAATLGLTNLDSATYSIEITGAKDYSIRTNESDKITASFTLGDNKAPTVDGVVLTDAANGKVTLYFSEAMDAASVSSKDNYMVDLTGNGSYVLLSTITGGAVAAGADLKTAVLTIPGATTNTDLKVLGLKDASGKITTDFNVKKDVSGVSTFNHTNITSVTATAVNKLEVVSNTPFGAVSPSTFVVIDGSDNADALVATNAQLDSTKTKLTLTLNGNLTPDGKLANGHTPKLATVSGDTLTTNAQGGALTIAKADAESITETIKPVFTTVAAGNTIDNNSTVESNQFTVTFSEPIAIDGNTDEALLLTDLVVKDSANKLVSASALNVLATDAANAIDGAKSVVIEVAAGVVDAGNQTFTVAIPAPRNIEDANGNIIEEAAAKNVTINVVAVPGAPSSDLAVGTTAGKTTLTNVDSTMEYEVNDSGNWVAITGTSVEIAVNKGDEIKVRVAAANGAPAGTEQTLTVDYADIKAAAAPTGVDLAQATEAGKTKLTGVAVGQEYKVGNGNWTDISGTTEDNIVANANDVIYVRVKETANQPASEEAQVTVEAGDITPTP